MTYYFLSLKYLLMLFTYFFKVVMMTMLGFFFGKKFYPGWFFSKILMMWKKYFYLKMKNFLFYLMCKVSDFLSYLIYKMYYLLSFFYHTYYIMFKSPNSKMEWIFFKHNYHWIFYSLRFLKFTKYFLKKIIFFMFYFKHYLERWDFFNFNVFSFSKWFMMPKFSFIYSFFIVMMKHALKPYNNFKFLFKFYMLYYKKIVKFIHVSLAKLLGYSKKEWVMWWIFFFLGFVQFKSYLKLESLSLLKNIKNFDIYWYISKIFLRFSYRQGRRLTYIVFYYYERGNSLLKKMHLYKFSSSILFFFLKNSFFNLSSMRFLFLIHFFSLFCLLSFYSKMYPFFIKIFSLNKLSLNYKSYFII